MLVHWIIGRSEQSGEEASAAAGRKVGNDRRDDRGGVRTGHGRGALRLRTQPSSDDVTLRLVAADYGDSAANSSEKYWDKLVAAYEKDHPNVTVDVTVLSWNDVDAKVKEMVDAGNAPDMAQIGAYADYAADDQLYKAGDVLSIPVEADFVGQLADAGKVRGVQYGLPFASSTRLLFYNKTLFEKAGLTAPTTWAELAADATALKQDGVKYPYALPLGSEEAQAETMQWLLSGGAATPRPSAATASTPPRTSPPSAG